jgi:hypothetical protein
MFDDGDWSFAEISTRPWSKVLADSESGKAIMSLYKRYKPTVEMLCQEGANLKITKDFIAYIEDAFDAELSTH